MNKVKVNKYWRGLKRPQHKSRIELLSGQTTLTTFRLPATEKEVTIKERLNCATTSLDSAISFSERCFRKYLDKPLYQVFPNFRKNYISLQRKLDYALDIPRYKMPVIEPDDMDEFERKIKSGHIDIFAPYASRNLFPKYLTKKSGKKWLMLGFKDGKINDDQIPAKIIEINADKLKPMQSQIWLNLLIEYTIKYGVPEAGSKVTKTTIIISKEHYILDGHHRFGQVMLANPKIKMRALLVPLDIGILLKMGRSYGHAIGRVAQK